MMVLLLLLSRLRIENTEPSVSVHGFSNYTDVVADDLVPWTPLKTSKLQWRIYTCASNILYPLIISPHGIREE